jgi:transposase
MYNRDMAYSEDTRKMVMDYLSKGHTQMEAVKNLGVSKSSVIKWSKMLRETGNLADKGRKRNPYKIPNEELRKHIAANPDAYFTEIAAQFGCSDEGIRKACKRLGITRKKKTKRYRERNEERRQEFLDEIKDISP